ncbi:substrate-binding periplasmic protein [Vibrio sp. SCSIO 43137]|uniref:substrate-binding periplasmic protein n=1 Tax=Vibrio sp. SCSIO 43137 TaxID=3021011 RepID=UPI00230773DF|nr:transporter substrate-binding domain-containing protein [Vibrio sp. SCSIO 43137]WCE32052.1 transporter substrate-binding domain-containing protein [Vibrio sp. SCSIO 43137]
MKRTLCAMLLLLFCSATWAHSQKLIVVRSDASYPPFEIMTEKGELSGVHIEMVQQVGRALDLEIEFQSLPWKRALYLIKQGKADAITYIGKSSEREEFALFRPGNVLSNTTNGLFIRESDKNSIHYSGDFASLKPYKIGFISGFSYGEKFDAVSWPNINDTAHDEMVLLKQLFMKRFTVGIGEINRMKYFEKQEDFSEQLHFLQPHLPPIPQYIAFSNNNRVLADKFEAAMKVFKQSAEYQVLLSKYGVTAIEP